MFKPNLVNQLQVGRNKYAENRANGYFVDPSLDSQLSVLSIPGYANPSGNPGDPLVTIDNHTGTGSSARNSLQTDEVWSAIDALNWNHGSRYVIASPDTSGVYNTFNQVNVRSPNGVWSSTTFGNITSAGPRREFELPGRVAF